jgi:hypothetical protein
VRIFISSTFEDLREYREATLRAIQTLGHLGDDMILWSADERQSLDLSLGKVRQSTVMVLLVAHRYGHVPPGSEISITEAEYRAARAAKIPVLAFFLDEKVPWPPAHVDRDRYQDLLRFKESVSTEVTRTTFTSTDNLAAQVTQALVLFQRRQEVPAASGDPLKGRTLSVSAPARLRTDPDIVVQIGQSEDGLPLLLRIRRGADLEPTFRMLQSLVTRPGSPSPSALLATFRQALEDFGATAWAAAHIEEVCMTDGTRHDLYVTRSTLSDMFGSLLTRLLLAQQSALVEQDYGSVVSVVRMARSGSSRSVPSRPMAALQSTGGANRFLGISPDDGSLHSVGRTADTTVQWRPYVTESLIDPFPEARMELPFGDVAGDDHAKNLLDYAIRYARPDGSLPHSSYAVVSVQDIARNLVKVCDAVAKLHGSGKVHGDLKPQNVLFGADGPALIDGFDVTPGSFAPGWTPNWSAPEQVLGLEMSDASDIYPLGIMISHLIGADLVGEVRKLRTGPTRGGRAEFDVFYNPLLSPSTPFGGLSAKTFTAWADVAVRCLRFDSDRRAFTATTLSTAIKRLLVEHPLPGNRVIQLTGRLVAATLIDGTSVVARLLEDAPQPSTQRYAPASPGGVPPDWYVPTIER